MSFKPNDYQQMSFNDSFGGLTKREQRFLEKSWAKYFGDCIFPAIDETPYAVLYSEKDSRPNCPVNVQIGALVLKELTGQSDDEIMLSLMFDARYQYALHTTSFEEQPISDRTLGRFRERCATYYASHGVDLLSATIKSLSGEMAKLMKLDHSLKRMDSMMVSSNIRRMSRLELLYTAVSNLVREVAGKSEKIPDGLEHYVQDNDRNQVIYHSKSEDTDGRITAVLKDAKVLKDYCEPRYDESSNYQLLIRVLREQAVEENGKYRLRTKEDGGMDSHILQNPADPEATFREKNGVQNRGYSANVVEISGENGSIVEDFQLEQNTHSDSQFMKESIERMGVQEEKVTIVADGAFSGYGIQKLAEQNNIEIINTNLTGRETADINADFEFNEDGTRVTGCPGGHEPKSCSYSKASGQCVCSFHREHCEACPYRDQCKPKQYAKTCRKIISKATKQRAIQQRERSTDTFKQMVHFRNGVETIPSIMRRKYNVDHMPVRGLIRCRIWFGLKIGALNFNKFCRYMQSLSSCTLAAAKT